VVNAAIEAIKADQLKELAKKAEIDRETEQIRLETEQIRLEALREERTILQLKKALEAHGKDQG